MSTIFHQYQNQKHAFKKKKSVHSKYREVKVVFPNNETLQVMSTSEENLRPDTSPMLHPAWIGGQSKVNVKEKSVMLFQKRFGSFFKK